MKRTLVILLACVLCLSFSACDSKSADTAAPVSFPNANFNNHYWPIEDFWAFDDTLFYKQAFLYNMGVYRSTDGSSKKLFEETDFVKEYTSWTIGDIFVCGSYLYFELYTDQINCLYRYDLNENTYAPVVEIPHLYRWVVSGDYFMYKEDPAYNNEGYAPLCVYNMKDGTTKQVCENVEEIGIVNGQLRYITYTDVYELYQYDYTNFESSLLGTFAPEFDKKYNIFNFTADAVVMCNWGKEYNRKLVVYTPSSDSTAVYTFPKGIQQLVAYDQYAYAVLYDTEKYTSDAVAAEENGIYRIHLADGSYEVVERNVDSYTKIHVVSDDRIYILQGRMNISIYREHVYDFDCTTGTKVKIAVF